MFLFIVDLPVIIVGVHYVEDNAEPTPNPQLEEVQALIKSDKYFTYVFFLLLF